MSRCAACGLPSHRYDTSDMGRHDKQACIGMLWAELDRLRRSDLWRQGWNAAIAAATEAWEDR